MSEKLRKEYKVAFDAVERVATAPGTQPGDRALMLAQLRNRISDHIVRLGEEAERARGGNPVSQRDGD